MLADSEYDLSPDPDLHGKLAEERFKREREEFYGRFQAHMKVDSLSSQANNPYL